MNIAVRRFPTAMLFGLILLSSASLLIASVACPVPATGAFTGCYFSNVSMTGNPAFVRTDPQINFAWGKQSPDPTIPSMNFSARWQGYFSFGAGAYTFTAIASDGMRIYVDGNPILVRWSDQPPSTYTVPQTLTAGSHLVTVEYYDWNGTATAQVSWQNNTTGPPLPLISSFTAVPASVTPGQPVILSWTVTGASSISLGGGIGDVTGRTSLTVSPVATTTYTLTASNGTGSVTAATAVTVSAAPDTQPPTVPTLLSATAKSAAEVDLAWAASTDNIGVAGYQIIRNSAVLGTVPAGTLTYADTTVSGSTAYSYVLKAYDVSGNYSASGNSLGVTTPGTSPTTPGTSPTTPGTSPTTPGCPAPAYGAFTGCYFSNVSLTGNPAFVRTDPQINFIWGKQSPDSSLSPMNFSARWQGTFLFTAGVYTFTTVMSDGMRLSIDGNTILARWSDQVPTTYTTTQAVSAGAHLVTVEYYDWNGTATAQVSWQNNTAGPPPPVISSFTASPANTTPGQPMTLSWAVSGASAITINNGIGDMTGRASITVNPVASTTYTLTASNAAGNSTATAAVTISQAPDTQPPTVPILVSATAKNATEVDLIWTGSTDNVALGGYQILRNGAVLGTVPATSLNYADTTVSASTTYSYAVRAYDAAGNYSVSGNSIGVTTPGAAPPAGSCPAPATGAFTGCYFNNITLSGDPVFVRTDNQINFYWGNQSPDPSLPPLGFSARWQGNFMFSSGVYKFTVITSDGMRLYIDGNPIIDRWRDQSANMYVASQSVGAGSHLIVVEYYERLGGATAQVSWENTTPALPGPVISSFTATPPSAAPGQSVSLAWTVSGATSLSIDNGIGDVTNRASVIVSPVMTTTYKLTASNIQGSNTAAATITISNGFDTQPPTIPTLVSANANAASGVDLAWTASTDNIAVIGYQILRNGSPVATVVAAQLTYSDTSASPSTTYTYAIKAYDALLNYSGASNSLSATTVAGPSVSVEWHGACWATTTLYGVTGNFQAMDFKLTTSAPVPLQGTLFFAAHCDTSQGTDNMNDFNTLIGSTHSIQGFSHHPNEYPTSALYWIGPRTADGSCAVGSPCSKCVEYTAATPNCDGLP